jgi:hypothetical protein
MVEPTKDELKETIRELRAKLKEMKELEKQVTATAKDLSQLGIGVIKDSAGKYSLVEIKYDVEKNAAVIDKVVQLDTHDFAIATYKANQTLAERILRKVRGDKYVG